MDSRNGTLEENFGVEQKTKSMSVELFPLCFSLRFCSPADWGKFLPAPSSWFRWHFQCHFQKKETDKADVFSVSLCNFNN